MPSQEQKSKDDSGKRVERVHGGETVELVKTPEPMNDPECEHEWERDLTETDFVAFICTKPSCGVVSL